jgi:hypothetical protein
VVGGARGDVITQNDMRLNIRKAGEKEEHSVKTRKVIFLSITFLLGTFPALRCSEQGIGYRQTSSSTIAGDSTFLSKFLSGLTRFGDPGLGMAGLGKTLKTSNEIRGFLNPDGHPDNGRDGELHSPHVVCNLRSNESTILE